MAPGDPVQEAAVSRDRASVAEPAMPEPARVRELRQTAAVAYAEAPWPSSARDEDWRRTPQIDRLDPARFQLAPAAGPLASAGRALPGWLREAARALPQAGLETVTLIDDAAGSHPGSPPVAGASGSGLEVWPLEVALQERPALVTAHLATVLAPGQRTFVALNTARFLGGSVVHVARGTEATQVVHLLHGVGAGEAAFPRTLVVLEEGAACTVVEEWLGPPAGDPALLVPVTEVVVGANARCRHVLVERTGSGAVLQASVRARVARDGRYEASWLLLGGAWQKTYLEVDLAGAGSSAQLSGLTFGGGTRHVDLQTLQAHLEPAATSDLLYRVAMRDRARSIYGGLIRVAPAAQKTSAYVQNRNLLLSPQAKADSNPTLEIEANDVRCTHGATAGPVDPDQLFYCETRGIDREAARQLIVEGFFADVLDRLPAAALRTLGSGWLQAAFASTAVQPG